MRDDLNMGFHGIQLLGISIVLAALALGSTSIITTSAGVYTPNASVAAVGVAITLLGAVADPVIEMLLRRLSPATLK